MRLRPLPAAVSLLVLDILACLAPGAGAVTFDLQRTKRRIPDTVDRRFRKRLDVNGAYGNGSTTLGNAGDASYSCNITLGGQEFEVLIDTGSSDLWVAGDVSQTTDLKVQAGVNYAKGSAQGNINLATLVFDTFTINNQAYIKVDPSSDNPAGQGLIGLGPNTASQVYQTLNKNSTGNSVLNNLFLQNTSTPNIITVFLSRDSGQDATANDGFNLAGQLTVGEVIPAFAGVNDQGKLPALKDEFNVQHWQTVMDADGVIGPDGNAIATTTTVTDSANTFNHSQLHVIFDTGFTIPQLPRNLTDEIYGRVPGADFITQSDSPGYWRIPCDYELNVSFVFSGVKYPVSPLDLNIVETADDSGNPVTCMAGFQEIAPAVADHENFGAFDAILGMGFLRNVYLLINFGDFVEGSKNTADPFIQLLTTLTPSTAHSDFVTLRMGGTDKSSSQTPLLPAGQGKVSPVPANTTSSDTPGLGTKIDNAAKDVGSWIKSHLWIAIVAGVAGLLVVVGLAWVCCCRGRGKRNAGAGNFIPMFGQGRSYQPLRDPRPDSPVWDAGPKPVSYGNTYAQGGRGYATPNYSVGGR